jgi:hypothetical protein
MTGLTFPRYRYLYESEPRTTILTMSVTWTRVDGAVRGLFPVLHLSYSGQCLLQKLAQVTCKGENSSDKLNVCSFLLYHG